MTHEQRSAAVRSSVPVGLETARAGIAHSMTFGTSLFLIAVGAILRYALTATVSGVSLTTVGLILMIIGAAGLVLSLILLLAAGARRGEVVRERVIEHNPRDEQPAAH